MYKLTQPLHSAATSTPDRLATVCQDREATWGELRGRTAKLASGIRQLGIRAGERTAILALNSDRYLEYLLGSWWAGATVVPMNTRWSASEHAYSLNDSGARVLFVDAGFAPVLEQVRPALELELTVVYIDDGEAPESALKHSRSAGMGLCPTAQRPR